MKIFLYIFNTVFLVFGFNPLPLIFLQSYKDII